MAEKPTSSRTMYTTLGAPSGAFGGSKGDQSGTESRMSTLIVPLNGSLTMSPPSHGRCARDPGTGRSHRDGARPPRQSDSPGSPASGSPFYARPAPFRPRLRKGIHVRSRGG